MLLKWQGSESRAPDMEPACPPVPPSLLDKPSMADWTVVHLKILLLDVFTIFWKSDDQSPLWSLKKAEIINVLLAQILFLWGPSGFNKNDGGDGFVMWVSESFSSAWVDVGFSLEWIMYVAPAAATASWAESPSPTPFSFQF